MCLVTRLAVRVGVAAVGSKFAAPMDEPTARATVPVGPTAGATRWTPHNP